MAGRIFISYSKSAPKPTHELAEFLTAQGYSVWWDTNLTSGEVFREVIDREIEAADAVIVIWTAHSIASNWVIAEADHAARRNRLIPVRTEDLEPWRIPKPYTTYHTDVISNREAILAAVKRIAGEPPKPSEVKPPQPTLSEAALHEALALEHWHAVKGSADPTKLQEFLAHYGDSKCAGLARGELERLAEARWKKLAKSKDARALEEYAHSFAGTPHSELARSRIESLAARDAQQRTSGRSGEQNKVVAWINRHPQFAAFIWMISFIAGSTATAILSKPHGAGAQANGLFLISLVWLLSAVFLLSARWRSFFKSGEFVFYWFGGTLVLTGLLVYFWVGNPNRFGLVGLVVLLAATLCSLLFWRILRRNGSVGQMQAISAEHVSLYRRFAVCVNRHPREAASSWILSLLLAYPPVILWDVVLACSLLWLLIELLLLLARWRYPFRTGEVIIYWLGSTALLFFVIARWGKAIATDAESFNPTVWVIVLAPSVATVVLWRVRCSRRAAQVQMTRVS